MNYNENNDYNNHNNQYYNNHQKQTNEYPSLFLRFIAFLLDGVILGVIASIIYIPLFFIGIISMESDDGLLLAIMSMIASFIFTIIMTLYYCILTAKMQGTLGKKICSLKVVNVETGQNLTFLQAFIRFAIYSVLGIFTMISLFFNNEQRMIHDLAAKSIVLKK